MDGFQTPAAIAADRLHGPLATIAAAAERHDREASFPADSLAALHRDGLLALTVPARLGGGGGGLAASAGAVAAVGAVCASTGLVFAMQCLHQRAVAGDPGWPAAVRDRVGRDAATAGGLVNALRVEPELGTPSRGGLPATRARRTPDGWRLSGRKIYSTGAPGLRWLLIYATTDEATARTGAFLVPADAPGIRIVGSWDQLGLRASGSDDVVLDDVAIPAEYAGELREPRAWTGATPEFAAWNAALIGSLYSGVARAARDWAVRFLRDRVPSNLGAPLATLPRLQEAMGEVAERLTANEWLIAGLAAVTDAGAPPPVVESNMLKVTLAENAIAAVERAVSVGGNHALSRHHPIERHLRDVLCARVHAPQVDAARLAAGRALLGSSS